MKTKSGIKFTVLAVSIIFFSAMFPVSAQDSSAPVVLSIEKLTLFKNGIGFFVSSGSVPAKVSSLRIGQLPIPSYGTFWVGYSKDLSVKKITSSIEEYSEQSASFTFDQLIEANIGKKVQIRIDSAGKDFIEGTILSLTRFPDIQSQPNPYLMETRRISDSYSRPAYNAGGLVMLKTEKGIVTIYTTSIMRLDFADADPVKTVKFKQKKPSLQMEFEKNFSGGKLSVS